MSNVMTKFGPRAAVGAICVALAWGLPASIAHAQETKLVVQGGAPVPYSGFLQVYVGQQGGFFKQEGLNVEMRYASGAPQATQITAANQADVGIVTSSRRSTVTTRAFGARFSAASTTS